MSTAAVAEARSKGRLCMTLSVSPALLREEPEFIRKELGETVYRALVVEAEKEKARASV